jgi:hypothetical protein
MDRDAHDQHRQSAADPQRRAPHHPRKEDRPTADDEHVIGHERSQVAPHRTRPCRFRRGRTNRGAGVLAFHNPRFPHEV